MIGSTFLQYFLPSFLFPFSLGLIMLPFLHSIILPSFVQAFLSIYPSFILFAVPSSFAPLPYLFHSIVLTFLHPCSLLSFLPSFFHSALPTFLPPFHAIVHFLLSSFPSLISFSFYLPSICFIFPSYFQTFHFILSFLLTSSLFK